MIDLGIPVLKIAVSSDLEGLTSGHPVTKNRKKTGTFHILVALWLLRFFTQCISSITRAQQCVKVLKYSPL